MSYDTEPLSACTETEPIGGRRKEVTWIFLGFLAQIYVFVLFIFGDIFPIIWTEKATDAR